MHRPFLGGPLQVPGLLDEKALAACLAYVDLNPVRAKMAETPETSEYTSARQRIQHASCDPSRPETNDKKPAQPKQPSHLFPFAGYPRQDMPEGLPFRLQDYLELLDWTGRQVRQGKRGSIDETLPRILERLNLNPEQWLYTSTHFESQFKGLVGTVRSLKKVCRNLGYIRTPSLSAAKAIS